VPAATAPAFCQVAMRKLGRYGPAAASAVLPPDARGHSA